MKYLKFKCKVKNENGLHARPTTKLCEICNTYEKNISIKYKKLKVDGKKIIDVLTLAAVKGSKLEFIIEYDNIKKAESIKNIIYSAFESEFS